MLQEGIRVRCAAAVVEKMKPLKVGDARKKGTDIGPVVDERQLAQNLEYLGIGKKEGAKLAFGGDRLEKNGDGLPGFYITPSLFVDTQPNLRINRQGIFGPVVDVLRPTSS